MLIPCPSAALLPPHHQVYHPNIDLEGNICLNILREDWKPVLSISSVVYGLQFLFLVSAAGGAGGAAGMAV
jgi:ubiquitin-protein ligase